MRRPLIRFPEPVWRKLHEHGFAGGNGEREQVAFCYASLLEQGDRRVLLVRDLRIIEQGALAAQNEHFVEVTQDAKVSAVLHARRTQTHLIEVHTHPGPLSADDVSFSDFDEQGQLALQRYLAWKLPEQAWAALVLGQRSAAAAYWHPKASGPEPAEVWSVGDRLFEHTGGHGGPSRTEERFARQAQAFGQDGQRRLAGLRVGVVGLGGLGAAVVQLLAYLGVVSFVLIDPDLVEETNLNRLLAAFPSDLGRPKVAVFAEMLRRLRSDCEVEILQTDVRTPASLTALAGCDLLVGTVDNDGARLVLAELAATCLLPYFDAASDVVVRDGQVIEVGGRVCAWWPGVPCLYCRNELDRDEVRATLRSSHEHQLAQRLGYAAGAALPSPSVVHVNGHVAASLVSELHALVTGWRRAHSYLSYNSSKGVERPRIAESVLSCPVCHDCLATGDLHQVSRFASPSNAA